MVNMSESILANRIACYETCLYTLVTPKQCMCVRVGTLNELVAVVTLASDGGQLNNCLKQPV